MGWARLGPVLLRFLKTAECENVPQSHFLEYYSLLPARAFEKEASLLGTPEYLMDYGLLKVSKWRWG